MYVQSEDCTMEEVFSTGCGYQVLYHNIQALLYDKRKQNTTYSDIDLPRSYKIPPL